MTINIRRLVCNVTVKTKEKKSPLNKDAKSKQPDLQFRAAPTMSQGQAGAPGGETATEDKGPATGKSEVSASTADPQKVADRVYQLMLDEVRLGRLRNGGTSQ